MAQDAVETTGSAIELVLDRTGAPLTESKEAVDGITRVWIDASLLLARLLQREGSVARALLIGSLRQPVNGVEGVGVIDLYVLRR